MTESEYNRLVEEALERIENALDASEVDADWERTGGGLLEMSFEDGSKIVVSRQAAMQEIWVAARSGGFHYRWEDGAWRDTRSRDELFDVLSRLVSVHAGVQVRF